MNLQWLRRPRLVVLLASILCPFAAAAQEVRLVTTTAPSGPGSLAAAVAAMQANGQTQVLRFQLPAGSVITLAASLPELVGTQVEILGTDTPGLVIDGAGAHRIFRYPSGQSLLLRDLTLRNGRSGNAGCLSSNATLITQAFDVRFIGCRTDGTAGSGSSGGALFAFGPLRLTRTHFEANVAGDGGIDNLSLGGGAVSFNGTSLLIEQSAFVGNYTLRTERAVGGCVDGVGGALVASVATGGSLTIRDTRFVGNAHRCGTPTGAFSGQGGAISIFGPATGTVPVFAIESSYFGGNRADNGAGVFARSVRLNATNVAFHDNAGRAAGAILLGRIVGGTTLGELGLVNVTFWNNATQLAGFGADLQLVADSAVVRSLRNVLFAPSAAGSQCSPAVFQADAGAANFVAGSDCVAFLPGGETITLEFGATNTFGLQAPSDRDSAIPILDLALGSIAIDNGANAGCPARDARNLVRPVDGDGNGSAVCDVGAIEWRRDLLVNGFEP